MVLLLGKCFLVEFDLYDYQELLAFDAAVVYPT